MDHLEERHHRDSDPQTELSADVRDETRRLVVGGLRGLDDVVVGNVDVQPSHLAHHGVVVVAVHAPQQELLGRRESLYEVVEDRIEGGMFVRALRQRRQTVGGVVDDVVARREAVARLYGMRVADRDVLVHVLATVHHVGVVVEHAEAGGIEPRIVEAGRRKLRQPEAVGQTVEVGRVGDAVVDAAACVHDLPLYALVLAGDERVLVGVVARVRLRVVVGAVAVRLLDARVLARPHSDRHRVSGQDVVAVRRRVRSRVGRVHDYARPLAAHQRRVRLLHAGDEVFVLAGRRQVAGAAREQHERQSVLHALQSRRSRRKDGRRRKREAVEVVRIEELLERSPDVTRVVHEATVDDEVVSLYAGH